MSAMSKGEEIVWATTYAVRWAQAFEKRETSDVDMSPATCVEEAHAAVFELREARDDVARGWGIDSAEHAMICQILNIEP